MAAGCNNRCYAFQTHTRQVYASLPGAARKQQELIKRLGARETEL